MSITPVVSHLLKTFHFLIANLSIILIILLRQFQESIWEVEIILIRIQTRKQKSREMKANKQIHKLYATVYSKTTEVSQKEQQAHHYTTTSFSKTKKSHSLSTQNLQKDRFKKISQVYRVLSSDKLNLRASKSRLCTSSHTPEKKMQPHSSPFAPLALNCPNEQEKQKKKLTLQRGTENPTQLNPSESRSSSWAPLVIKLRTISDRLDNLLKIRSEEMFAIQFQTYLEILTEQGCNPRKDYTGREQLSKCFRMLTEGHARRERSKIAQVRSDYSAMTQELSTLRIQLNKKMLQIELDQYQLQRNREELTEFRRKLLKFTCDECFGTDEQENEFIRSIDYNQSDNAFNTHLLTLTAEQGFFPMKNPEAEGRNSQLTECKRKLQSTILRQRELLAVLVVLREEGIDVEKVYNDVINGRIESNDEEMDEIAASVDRIKKGSHQKHRSIKVADEFDADNSIISSADGLSFNYDEKSLVEDAYTIRREYKCKHELSSELKERLKLNFDVLYDDEFPSADDESVSEMAQIPPTV